MSDIASARTSRLLRLGWIASAIVCVLVMAWQPGHETIPFHLIWIGLCLVYGFTAWRPLEMILMVSATTVVTGAVMIDHAATGAIEWAEVAEVPLSLALTALIAAYLHRRHVALAELARRAEIDRRRADLRQQLVRQVSHELRTPITVARGYTELVRKRLDDPALTEDTAVVLEELDKLAEITQRLITLFQVDGEFDREPVPLGDELVRLVRRWMPAAERKWKVHSTAGEVPANRDRLEAALDCLLDNAVKFTRPGDEISVLGRIDREWWSIEVADAGVGLGHAQNHASPGTGLGLAMVRNVIGAWGGTVLLAARPQGGTVVTLRIPTQDDSPVIDLATAN
jgi:two-component system OmpR family sensor kinase